MTDTQPRHKILLAEDDGDDAAFFFDFLQHRSDVVLLPSVTNGVEVIDYLESVSSAEELPDVIVLDQNMPKLTGLETLQFIKANDRYANIVVAIYSTYAGQQLTEECLKLGASLVETKPFSKEGYNDMLDNILKALN
jgi:CheY-like chemotaxis protein